MVDLLYLRKGHECWDFGELDKDVIVIWNGITTRYMAFFGALFDLTGLTSQARVS